MPPLSAYTPFESLLFFQCLASLNTRPTNFAAISDTLRKNQFIKEDDAFDTDRLSPQALEELYTTLLHEGFEDTSTAGDKHGHSEEGGNTNPKKRRISSSNVGASASMSHTAIVPELVSQLYARYKDRVTKEIRDEEKRYRDISEEIERLQKDISQEPAVSAPPQKEGSADAAGVTAQPSSERKDSEIIKDVKVAENVTPPVSKVPEQGIADAQARPSTVPATPKPKPPSTIIAAPSKLDHAPIIPAEVKQQALPSVVIAPREGIPQQPQAPQIPQQQKSKHAASGTQMPIPVTSTPIKSPVNGKGTPLAPQPPVMLQPSPKIQVKVPPPPQPQRLPPQAAPRTSTAANRNQPILPPGSTIVFQAQQGSSLPATPTTQRHAQTNENHLTKATPVPKGSPAIPQLPNANQQFQKWAPQSQTGVVPATPNAPSPYNAHPIMDRPVMPQQGIFTSQPSAAAKAVPGPIQSHVPVTPSQIPSAMQTPQAQIHQHKTPYTQTPSVPPLKQQRPHRPSMDTAGSLTPWKRTPNLRINIPETPGSPPRPKPEDVSPISETAPSPIEPIEPSTQDITSQKKHGRPEAERPRRGRKQSVPPPDHGVVGSKADKSTAVSEMKRAGSTTSTRSRARSVASRDDESATDSALLQRRIKHEAPSTPAGVSDDVDMETRAGTRRKVAAVTSLSEEMQAKTRPKRKRGASDAPDVDIAHPTLSRAVSSQLVYCTRNFPRTGAPIMNDVAAHKHASIFAKPLTEREAPGYKDLIFRPQDLKSIKSALNQGNKAVAAATEAANTAAEVESPNPTNGTPSKNTAWLARTSELIPPKAIVNSSQLEKELIRMFANAVMFNPAPERERGFGPSFRMRKSNESRSSSQPWDLDEGGIIRDTREMCDDVEKAVTKWRAAERTTTDDSANKSMLSLRGSSGDSNADGTDADNKG